MANVIVPGAGNVEMMLAALGEDLLSQQVQSTARALLKSLEKEEGQKNVFGPLVRGMVKLVICDRVGSRPVFLVVRNNNTTQSSL